MNLAVMTDDEGAAVLLPGDEEPLRGDEMLQTKEALESNLVGKLEALRRAQSATMLWKSKVVEEGRGWEAESGLASFKPSGRRIAKTAGMSLGVVVLAETGFGLVPLALGVGAYYGYKRIRRRRKNRLTGVAERCLEPDDVVELESLGFVADPSQSMAKVPIAGGMAVVRLLGPVCKDQSLWLHFSETMDVDSPFYETQLSDGRISLQRNGKRVKQLCNSDVWATPEKEEEEEEELHFWMAVIKTTGRASPIVTASLEEIRAE